MSDATGKIPRWLPRLSEMSFDVIRRAGLKHQTADALSCLQMVREDTSLLDDDLPVLTILESAEDSDEENTEYAESDPSKDGGSNESDMLAKGQKSGPLLPPERGVRGKPGSQFDMNRNGFFVRRSSEDVALQRLAPETFLQQTLVLRHKPVSARHPGMRQM